MSHPWTLPERVEALKRMWAEGLSCSTIAGRLSQMCPNEPPVTRNAVIGKVNRLGLEQRARKPAKPRPRPSLPVLARPAHWTPQVPALRQIAPEPQPDPIRLLDIPKGERVTLLMLTEKTCRWPMGDPGSEDFFFCGTQPKTGLPYCEYHSRIAYETVYERRRRQQILEAAE